MWLENLSNTDCHHKHYKVVERGDETDNHSLSHSDSGNWQLLIVGGKQST